MGNNYVTSSITLNKTADKRASVLPTNTEFFTYDQNVARKTILFQLAGEPLDLTNANVILGFYFASADSSMFLESADGSIIIENAGGGKTSIMLPNATFAYSGQVLIYAYVVFGNGQSLDYPAFSIEFQESWIDQDLEEMAKFYVQRFEDLREPIRERAAEIEHEFSQFDDLIDQIKSFDIEKLAEEIEAELRNNLNELTKDVDALREDVAEFSQAVLEVTGILKE